MGVGVERDVGEAEALADQPVAAGQMLVHQRQRRLPRRALARDLRALRVAEIRLADQPSQKRSVATLGS